MKNCFTIALLIFLCSCINSNKKARTRNKAENIQKKYRNYEFDVRINVEHSAKDFKYLINVKDEIDDNGNFTDYEDKLLQYTTYKYQKSMKFGDRYFDRVAIKTAQYSLNKVQLDTIYLLTAKLFQPDTLNLTDDTTKYSRIYDGYHAEIVLNDRFDATYVVKLTGLSNVALLKKYQNLLYYIEKSKKRLVNKPGKKRIEPT